MRQKRRVATLYLWGLPRTIVFRFSDGKTLADLPHPMFQIGDTVWAEYISDDDLNPGGEGKPKRDYGIITGLMYDSSESLDTCWCYQVHWTWLGFEPAIRAGGLYVDITEEYRLHHAEPEEALAGWYCEV